MVHFTKTKHEEGSRWCSSERSWGVLFEYMNIVGKTNFKLMERLSLNCVEASLK